MILKTLNRTKLRLWVKALLQMHQTGLIHASIPSERQKRNWFRDIKSDGAVVFSKILFYFFDFFAALILFRGYEIWGGCVSIEGKDLLRVLAY